MDKENTDHPGSGNDGDGEDESSSFEDLSNEPVDDSEAKKPSPKKVLDARINFNKFKIHVLTWNIASAELSTHDIESLFVPQESFITNLLEDVDLLVIGLQEAYPSVQSAVQANVPFIGKDPLVELFSLVLSSRGFARLAASRLLGIVTMVFVQRPILCYIHNVETNTTKTGVGGMLGNKGASSVHFSLSDVSLCFLNCHLVPHPENNARRLEELGGIFLDQKFSTVPFNLVDHDVLILLGDLNFRLEGQVMEEVVDVVKHGKWQDLLRFDQLRLEQSKGLDLSSKLDMFMEMPITFQPSYKYEVGTDVFDGGPKRRAPAWCDRILWRTHERRLPKMTDPDPRPVLQYHYYNVHMQPRVSDHKAVCAGMAINVSLEDQVPLVVFNVMHDWRARKSGTVAFEMTKGSEVSMWDWIGLFPDDFINVDKDYVSWVYTPAKSKFLMKGNEYVKPLQPDQVPESGRYMLVYKSYSYGRVIGMSPIFRIQ